jgi:ATP:corrinoid adenosyltransferase
MKEQKEILHDIDELHSSISPMEYNQLYAVTFRKWCNQCREFAYYFENQWNSGTAFNQWKIHCCPPGVATTNNSLESFNAIFKRTYTNHTRHTMAALYDIIYDQLLVDLSRELLHARKVFHLKRKPDRESVIKANTINQELYHISMSGTSI